MKLPLAEEGKIECGAVWMEVRDQGLTFTRGKYEMDIRKPVGEAESSVICMRVESGDKVCAGIYIRES